MPPRYFTPRLSNTTAAQPGVVAHPMDVFLLEQPQGSSEWVVGLDASGALSAEKLEDVSASAVRAQLAFHEISGRNRRRLQARELFLFQLALMEQAPDCPGLDDPVYLYGTLLGPLSRQPPTLVEGQLTVSRGDLLEGAVMSAPHAFRYGSLLGEPMERNAARAFHLLIPPTV